MPTELSLRDHASLFALMVVARPVTNRELRELAALQITAGVHHPLRGSDAPGLTELSNWPWILYPTSTALRKVSDHIFSSTGLSLTSGIVETPSFLFALELMQSTNMLSLQPAALVDKYVRRGLLTRIASELPDRMPDSGLITLQGEAPSTAVLAFMDVIRNMALRARVAGVNPANRNQLTTLLNAPTYKG